MLQKYWIGPGISSLCWTKKDPSSTTSEGGHFLALMKSEVHGFEDRLGAMESPDGQAGCKGV
jgi:hypothetical protein